jgi:hypothetical protein
MGFFKRPWFLESGLFSFVPSPTMRLIAFFLLLAALYSCERDVNFDLAESEPKLVIEATIENGQPPVVILTRSFNYFAKIDTQILAGSFIHGAEVYISTGARTHKLKEYAVPAGSGNTVYYYSIDSSSLATAFVGTLNTAYTLKVIAEGREYTSATTIPNITKRIDSLWWKPAPALVDSNKALVMVRATDPPGFGDYIRYYTKRNSERFFPPYTSAFDDQFIDGTTYELQLERGVDRNRERDDDEVLFHRGDTVTFKISSIDKATYDFWRTMEYSYASVGNPFSTPIKVSGNVSGNALGYFGGYASQYHTIIIR